MKMIKLTPNSNTDIDEFRKSISFVSSDICSVDFDNGNFFIGISSQGNEEKIKDDLVHMMAKYRTNSDDKECFLSWIFSVINITIVIKIVVFILSEMVKWDLMRKGNFY